jgi:hypothetical protein
MYLIVTPDYLLPYRPLYHNSPKAVESFHFLILAGALNCVETRGNWGGIWFVLSETTNNSATQFIGPRYFAASPELVSGLRLTLLVQSCLMYGTHERFYANTSQTLSQHLFALLANSSFYLYFSNGKTMVRSLNGSSRF